MSDEGGARGILLAHGAMAEGLVDAMRRISGAAEGVVVPLSNEGKSPQALREELDRILGDGPGVIFTDLPSGSCALAAHFCARARGNQAVVSGVNLPVLLDFVFNRHLPMQELVPRLLSRGIDGLRSVPEYL